ncbi:MAG: hypothetical protein KY475_21950 [Planctomycetes bacterium]|nr:hypothetical protein [Planctomycetota bacterium]
MNVSEETIQGTLDSNGQLQLPRPPRVPPGPVQVTIRAAGAMPRRGLADVGREIAAEQRSRGFSGRSAEQISGEDAERLSDDGARDHELDAARRATSRRGA